MAGAERERESLGKLLVSALERITTQLYEIYQQMKPKITVHVGCSRNVQAILLDKG